MTEGRVLGTGIDLVETGRMQEVLGRWGQAFRNRVFLPEEQAYCDSLAAPWRHYAGRFAVKEAVSKAFGTGIGPAIGLLDMEVVRDAVSGAPSIRLRGRGIDLLAERGVERILVSLSHTRHYAVAQALLIGRHADTGNRAP